MNHLEQLVAEWYGINGGFPYSIVASVKRLVIGYIR